MPIATVEQIIAAVVARGDLTIDLAADAGAVPGLASKEDTREALQRCVDACEPAPGGIRETGQVGVRIDVPCRASSWVVGREVWVDQEKVNFRGAGLFLPGIQLDPGRHGPALIFGIKRRPFGVPVPEARFQPIAGESGKYSFLADRSHWLAQRAGVLDLVLDAWKDDGFTVQFSWIQGAGGQPIGPLCGLSDRDWPSPWRLKVAEGSAFGAAAVIQLEMLVREPDWLLDPAKVRPPVAGDLRAVAVAAPSGAGRHEVVFRVNLATGLVRGWVDGTQVQVKAWSGSAVVNVTGLALPNYTAGAALTLAGNERAPFLIGSASVKANMPGSDFMAIAADYALTVAGLKLSLEDQFQDLGVGQPLTPASGRSADIYATDPGTIALLPMDRDGATAAPSRSIDVQVGVSGDPVPTVGSMFIYSIEHATPAASFGGHVLQDLSVGANPAGGAFGKAVSLGWASYIWATGCSFDGGGHGVGDENFGASYTQVYDRCVFGGGDANLYAEIGIVFVNNCQLFRMGRACFRFSTTTAVINGCFVAPTGHPDYFCRADGAADVTFRDTLVDVEFGGYPRVCGFYSETSSDQVRGGRLALENLAAGQFPPPGRPLVMLRSGGGSENIGQLLIDRGLMLYPVGQSAVVDVSGPYWRGRIRLDHPLPGVETVRYAPGPRSRFTVEVP